MIIKTFRASTSSAALKQVREQMGGDAIVLKSVQTSDESNRTVFEVTACVERTTVSQNSKIFPDKQNTATTTLTKDEPVTGKTEQPSVSVPKVEQRMQATPKINTPEKTPDETLTVKLAGIESMLNKLLQTQSQVVTDKPVVPNQLDQLRMIFQQHDISPIFSDLFLATIEDECKDKNNSIIFAEQKLVQQLSNRMLPSVNFLPGETISFVGPAGSGKSSVMGKLAAELIVRRKQKISLKTLDTSKVGAFDEINAYSQILNAPIKSDDEDSEQPVYDNSITLIDTPAMPLHGKSLDELKNKLLKIRPNYIIAVLSALIRNADLEKFSSALNELRPTHIAVTMTDLTDCKGIYINGPHCLDKKILFTTDSYGGVGELHSPDPARLVRDLLNLEVDSE